MLQRLVGIRNVPPHIVALTAAASYAAEVFAILQGWPVWAVVLATLLPWAPLFASEVGWTYRHYGWLALFYVLVLTQLGHVGEHVAQVVQIHLLGLKGPAARGVFGALDVEWVHFIWNSWVLIAVALLFWRFRANRWLAVTLVLAGWHEVEHAVLISTYISTGVAGTPGLLARGGALFGGTSLTRPDLHMLYNVFETTPLVIAFAWQLRHAYDVWLKRALPHLGEDALAETTDRCRTVSYAPGDEIVRQGDPSDRFYVISAGEVAVVRRADDGRDTELRTLRPGEYFGEIGLLSLAPRTATVRAKTAVELLTFDRATFQKLVERSEATAADLRRAADQRLAGSTAGTN